MQTLTDTSRTNLQCGGCARKLPDTAKFCSVCGLAVGSENNEQYNSKVPVLLRDKASQQKSASPPRFTAILRILLAGLVVIACFLFKGLSYVTTHALGHALGKTGFEATYKAVNPKDPDTEKVIHGLKLTLEEQQKAANSGRAVTDEEANESFSRLDDAASMSDSQTARNLHRIANLGRAYRAIMAEFKSVGGADIDSIRARNDIKKRAALLNTAHGYLKELGTDDNQAVDMELEIIEGLQFELDFYYRNWGKRQLDGNGNVKGFAVADSELDDFNKTVARIQDRSRKEIDLLGQSANDQLARLRDAK